MVMSTEPQGAEEPIEFIEPVVPEVAEEEAPPTEVADAAEPVSPEATAGLPSVPPVAPDAGVPDQAPAPAQPQVDQRAIQELQQRRAAENERQWREKIGRSARTYEQQLQEAGYMPEQARDQARRYVQHEQKAKQQDEEALNMIGYVEGRQAAAVHFLKKHGLANKQVLDDLIALQQTNTPAEMEKEAQRMRRERALVAENTQLKQGRVPPQTFDNSQGAAEASNNDARLLDAYINGDRSDAAVRAAARITRGS
jgi:hypothetical protein